MEFLPKELVSEILLKFPATSLVRFKCVCKSWRSIIENPSFIERHLFLQNDTNIINTTTDLYVLFNVETTTNVVHRVSYHTLGAVETSYLRTDPKFGKIAIVSCCNGLVLFTDVHKTKWFLWNPTTGHTKLLPPSPCKASQSKESDQLVWYLNVGLDAKSMDYKVVLINKLFHAFPWSIGNVVIEMYSLKNNSWKTISTIFSAEVVETIHGGGCVFSNNGMLSWIARFKEGGEARDTILSIDLSSETIITTSCPSSITFVYNSLLVYKESLALVPYTHGGYGERSLDIWVLGEYGVKESWKKTFTIGPLRRTSIRQVLGFWKDDKVFVVISHEGKLLLLDIATQHTTRLQISNAAKRLQISDVAKQLFIYRESLVSLN